MPLPNEPVNRYDALLLLSFGGPEKREDVIPFLENVLRGRNVPRERMLAVAEHYYHFGGRSPINDQCRELIAALEKAGVGTSDLLGQSQLAPMLADTVGGCATTAFGPRLAIATSAFGSYSGCRQYREDIEAARSAVTGAPEMEKLPPFWKHAGFIETMVDRVREALGRLPGADLVYTAHSIPVSMAQSSPYEQQLRERGQAGQSATRAGRAGARVSKPQRPAVAAVARAGYRRLHPCRPRRNGWLWRRSVSCPITWK